MRRGKGRDAAAVAARQAVYRGKPSPCPSDVDPSYHWPFAAIAGPSSFQVLETRRPPAGVNSFDAGCDVSDYTMSDEEHPDDMAMSVAFPQQGFFRPLPADTSWANRFVTLINAAHSTARTVALERLIRDFCEKAVPAAMYVAQNVVAMDNGSSYVYEGLQFEVPGQHPTALELLEDAPRQRNKLAHCEFAARSYLLSTENCRCLVVPFTILVNLLGCSVLVSPFVPLQESEQVYGCSNPSRLAHTVVHAADAEANYAMQALATRLNLRGIWMANSAGARKFLHASVETAVFRAEADNRLHLRNLRGLLPLNAATRSNDYVCYRFRPEFMARFSPNAVVADACAPFPRPNWQSHKAEFQRALQHLTGYIVPQAAQQFVRDMRHCSISDDTIRSGGLSHFMHSWGINMRLLREFSECVAHAATTSAAESACCAVEVEMAARATKQHMLSTTRASRSSLVVHRDAAADALRALLRPITPDFWKSSLSEWVRAKYGAAVSLSASRVTAERLVGRLVHLLGATITLRGEACCASSAIAYFSDVEINFGARVRCPPVPHAQFPEGEETTLCLVAKRFLRQSLAEGSLKPPAHQAFRYIEFLRQIGEGDASEVRQALEALQKKPVKVELPPAQDVVRTKTDDVAAVRIKGGSTTRQLSTAKHDMARFGFAAGQKLYVTRGEREGQIITVVGVRDQQLYVEVHHSLDGAEILAGSSGDDVIAQHGTVVVDPRLAALRARMKVTNVAPIHAPRILLGLYGYFVAETDAVALASQFGFAAGDVLQFRRGGRVGVVTTVLGVVDGHLWHHPHPFGPPEAFRQTDREALVAAFDFVRLSRNCPVPEALTDNKLVFADGKRTVVGGHRNTSPFVLHHRHVLRLQRGPYAGQIAIVLGTLSSRLAALVECASGQTLVSLGESRDEVNQEHDPRVIGVLAHAPACEFVLPPRRSVEALGDGFVVLSAAPAHCVRRGMSLGSRVRLVLGDNVGVVGHVVGSTRRQLWLSPDGADYVIPFDPESAQVVRSKVTTTTASHIAAPIWLLACSGRVLCLDASVDATRVFDVVHGQLLRCTIDGATRLVCVAGVADGALWYRARESADVLPFDAVDAAELRCRYQPAVVGVAMLCNWSDMFCCDSSLVQLSGYESDFQPKHFAVFSTSAPHSVGLDTRKSVVARCTGGLFEAGMTLLRHTEMVTTVDADGNVEHTAVGPLLCVRGVWNGSLFVSDVTEHGEVGTAVRALGRDEWHQWTPTTTTTTVRKSVHPLRGIPAAGRPRLSTTRRVTEDLLWGSAASADPHEFESFDDDTSQRLSEAMFHGKWKLFEGDWEFDLNAMRCQRLGTTGRQLRRCSLLSVETFCLSEYDVDLRIVAPNVLRMCEYQARVLFEQKYGQLPLIASGRDAFLPWHRHVLSAACATVPHAVVIDLLAVPSTEHELKEAAMRFHHVHCVPLSLQCTLRRRGVLPYTQQALDELMRLFRALESRVGLVDVAGDDDVFAYCQQQLLEEETAEYAARCKVYTDEHSERRLLQPECLPPCIAEPPQPRVKAVDTAVAAPQQTSYYTTADCTMLVLAHTHNRWQFKRGDVIEFGRGDLAGTRSVVVGFDCGDMLRRELNSDYGWAALRMSDPDDRLELYATRVAAKQTADVPDSDDIRWYSWDGSVLSLDASFRACQQFGFVAGERYTCTQDGGLNGWPFAQGVVVVVIGVAEGRPWFAVDHSGAMPFPYDCSTPAERYVLKRCCTAPVRVPSVDSTLYAVARAPGTLSDTLCAFLDAPRNCTLMFNVHRAMLETVGCTSFGQRMMCTAGPEKGTRLSIVGVRHGELWALRDTDSHARPLRDPVAQHALKPAVGEMAVRVTPNVWVAPIEATRAMPRFRCLTRSGTIGLFDVSAAAMQPFGLKHNDPITHTHHAPAGVPLRARVVGVSGQLLWRVDEGTDAATPFTSCADGLALSLNYGVQKCACHDMPQLVSHTY